MPVQSTVRLVQTSGIVGDLYADGPNRTRAVTLRSGTAANNVIGRAFTYVSGQDNVIQAGGTGAFAGILGFSKEYASFGTTVGGPLAPTLVLPNEMTVAVVLMGYMFVNLTSATNNIGYDVHFVQADGTLLAVPAGTAPAGGNTKVPNCQVDIQNTSAAGLAVIRLTN